MRWMRHDGFGLQQIFWLLRRSFSFRSATLRQSRLVSRIVIFSALTWRQYNSTRLAATETARRNEKNDTLCCLMRAFLMLTSHCSPDTICITDCLDKGRRHSFVSAYMECGNSINHVMSMENGIKGNPHQACKGKLASDNGNPCSMQYMPIGSVKRSCIVLYHPSWAPNVAVATKGCWPTRNEKRGFNPDCKQQIENLDRPYAGSRWGLTSCRFFFPKRLGSAEALCRHFAAGLSYLLSRLLHCRPTRFTFTILIAFGAPQSTPSLCIRLGQVNRAP